MAWGGAPQGGALGKPRVTHFIVLQAVDHQLGEDDHAGPPHPGAAVHDDRGVLAPGAFQHAVGVPADRLDLLQVGCKAEGRPGHQRPAWLCIQVRGGIKTGGEPFFFVRDNNLQFLQDTNYLAGTHCTRPGARKDQLGVN